jgi:hypothetical protein
MRKLRRPEPENVWPHENENDYTGSQASERTFHFNLKFIKFGTKDRFQGAAILLTCFLLTVLLILLLVGAFLETAQNWLAPSTAWVQNSLLFVMGIALGRATINREER